MDALLWQPWDGQVDLLRSAKLDGVAAGELRLLQHLHQVAQRLITAPLGAVPRGDTDGGESVVGRGGQVLCFPLLDVRRQFAAAVGFQLLYHIRAELGNQAEDMLSGEVLKAQPIHGIADRHIAGEAQQPFVHILRAQLRPHGTGRKGRKEILPLSDLKVPIPHLLFDVLPQCVINLLPARQPPQGIAEGDCVLIGKALQRQLGQIPLQQLTGEKRRSIVVPHHGRISGVVLPGGPVQNVLNTDIRLRQYLRGGIRLVDQVVAVMHAVAFW